VPPNSSASNRAGIAGVKAPNATPAEERSFAPIGVSERQLECLAWVQEGKSASDIGGILGISSRTVEGHILKVCEHLGVRTRIQAVLKARDLGLLRPPPP
jgi:DNA-binding CsgD family transcriptional regulator